LVTVQGDVADPNTASLVFKEALDRFGRVDTLINNAGTFIAKPFTSYANDDYASYIATNVTGFFHMTQRAMEMMSQARRGHVVTVTSSLVDQPMSSVPGVLTSLTKGALNAATRALHPMGRMGEISEIVDAILDEQRYLESANFITGISCKNETLT
jgi:NAD(P)-dependent dehydrogenase (short-subunit alcohol dehydrogenase family)